MKKFLIALATLLAVCNAQAQDSLKIGSEEPQMEDVLTLLDAMDIYIYRFNAEEFLKHKYNVSFFVDEYMDGVKKERTKSVVGKAMRLVTMMALTKAVTIVF